MSDEEKRINVLHKGRRMWAFIEGTLLIAPKYHGVTHEVWFRGIGMPEGKVRRVTRGFILGNCLYAYVGELMMENETVRDEALVVAQEMERLIDDKRQLPLRVFCGMKAGRPGDLWTPLVELDRTKGGVSVGNREA